MSEWSQGKADLALRLIEKRGTRVRLERRRSGAMTASGDRLNVPLPTDTAGLLLPGEGTVEVDGRVMRKARVLLAPVDPEPAPGDVLTVQGQKVVVTEARNLRPDGLLIYSDLEVGA